MDFLYYYLFPPKSEKIKQNVIRCSYCETSCVGKVYYFYRNNSYICRKCTTLHKEFLK